MDESNERGNHAVSLGCGTLIIIALIVLFLGRPDLDPLEQEVTGLREEIYALREDVTMLRRDLNRAVPGLEQTAPALEPESDAGG